MTMRKIKLSFKEISVPSTVTIKSLFVCIESDSLKFYSTKTKKVKDNSAKFYGDFLQIQLGSQKTALAIIDNSDPKSLKLIKRFYLNHEELKGDKEIQHAFTEDSFKINFTSQARCQKNQKFEKETTGTLNEFKTDEIQDFQEKQYEVQNSEKRRYSYGQNYSQAGKRAFPIVKHRKSSTQTFL